MKKIFIAGCGGMLGEAIYEVFIQDYEVLATDIDLNVSWLQYGDVRDYYGMRKMICDFKPDYIINLAAMTDLEECEGSYYETYATNALGVENLGIISNELDIPYVYISTAGIFNGDDVRAVFTDFDEIDPISIYAKAKAYGENFVLKMVRKPYVFRAGWMMGGWEKDKKFVKKICDQIRSGKKTLEVVNDKFGAPTYTVDFAKAIHKHFEKELPYGLYNQVCSGRCSRYDVAKEIVNILDKKIYILPIRSEYPSIKNKYFAYRPPSEALVNTKLKMRNANYMRRWDICLKEYLEENYHE